MFEVGRSAVREAITTLKGKGLVNVRHGEGTYICEFDVHTILRHHLLIPDMKDIEALFQVREMLETGMVRMAANQRTVEDLKEMTASIALMKSAHQDKIGELTVMLLITKRRGCLWWK